MDVEDLVKSYFRLGFSNKEILCLLAHQHGVIISKRTLQRLCRKLNLFRRKNQTDIEEIASFVQSEMATSGRLQGYRWLHLRAIRRHWIIWISSWIDNIDSGLIALSKKMLLNILYKFTVIALNIVLPPQPCVRVPLGWGQALGIVLTFPLVTVPLHSIIVYDSI